MLAPQRNEGRTRAFRLATTFGMLLLTVPILMAGGCPLSITISCPTDTIAAGETFMVTITVNGGTGTITVNTTAAGGLVDDPASLTPTITPQLGTIEVTSTATDESTNPMNVSDSCTVTAELPPCSSDADCDDGDNCTTNVCAESGCVFAPVNCGDQVCNPDNGDCVECLDDADCNADQACVDNVCETVCTADGDCDDGNACTDDFCTDGVCFNEDIDVDDGIFCNGTETCDPATGDVTSSGDPCEGTDMPFCDEASMSCLECLTDADCLPMEVCTDGTCVASAVCVEDADCDDGLFCNGVETCVDSACAAGTPPCTADETCDEDTDTCECTIPCTADADCDDGLFCNGEETCVDSCCVSGTPPCSASETCNEEIGACTAEVTVLTAEVDNVVGTAGNDIVRGVVQATAPTLSAGDSIDSAGGDGDRLEVTIVDANYNPIATIVRTEEILVWNTDSGTPHTFSAAGIEGANTLWQWKGLDALTFDDIDALVDLGVMNTGENLTATYNNSLLTGGDDSVTVYLSNVDGGDVVVESSGTAGFETIRLHSMDSPNELDSIDDGGENDFETLEITGDQDLTVNAIGSSVENIDGSAATGDLDIDATDADTNPLVVVLGPGNDTFTVDALQANHDIDGGDGDDTLVVGGAFAAATITNIEDASIDNANTTLSIDLANAQDLTDITVNNTADLDEFDLTNLPGGFALTIDSNVAAPDINTASNWMLLDDSGGSDETSLSLTGNATSLDISATLDTGELEMWTFNVEIGNLIFSVNDALDGGGDDTLETVVFTGSGDVDVDNYLADTNSFETVDASELTGYFDNNGVSLNNDAAGMTITTGSGADDIQGTSMDDIIDAGSGNNTVDSGGGEDEISSGNGNDTITGGAGDSMIDAGNGNNTVTGGTGDEDLICGSGNDAILGGGGSDAVTSGGGNDTIGNTGITAFGEVVTIDDFNDGTSTTAVDVMQFDLSDLNGLVGMMTDTSNNNAAAGDGTYAVCASDGCVVANADIVGLTIATYADDAALLAAFTGGNATIVYGAAIDDNDAYLVAYGTGNNINVAVCESNGAAQANSDTIDSVNTIFTLDGQTSFSDFDSSDFTYIP